MTEYAWGGVFAPAVPAQVIGDTVERIADTEGVCTPGRLVDEARSPRSPLHPLFEWRDQIAAERYREAQARRVIRSIRVVRDDVPDQAPSFVSVRLADTGQQGYRPVGQVVSDEGQYRQVLSAVISTLSGLRRRHGSLVELHDVWQAVDDVSGVEPDLEDP